MNVSSVSGQLALFLLGVILAAPGLAALYVGLRRDAEEKMLTLQVHSMAEEVQRLQVLTDDQAREIARLRVQVSTLQAGQKGVMDVARRLHRQLVDGGATPIVDVEKLGDLLG